MPDLILRTRKTYDKYTKLIANGLFDNGCRLCQETVIKNFRYWKILDNRFPWDQIAKTHHMIIPKRHIIFEQLNIKEKKEYEKIKSKYIEKGYDLIGEATNKKKSIPSHFHIHLIVLKTK